MSVQLPLFVYGTLRQGGASHKLLRNARLLRGGQTPDAYTLYNFDGTPGLRHEGSTRVVGELYAVDAPTVSSLDDYQEHPSYYRRTTIQLEDGTTVQTYLFVADEQGDPIASGDWKSQ